LIIKKTGYFFMRFFFISQYFIYVIVKWCFIYQNQINFLLLLYQQYCVQLFRPLFFEMVSPHCHKFTKRYLGPRRYLLINCIIALNAFSIFSSFLLYHLIFHNPNMISYSCNPYEVLTFCSCFSLIFPIRDLLKYPAVGYYNLWFFSWISQ
jgi:hypothetical protein